MTFCPHGLPLKTYLSTILDDQSNLDFLTSKIREIVVKEYTQSQDIDIFLDDVLKHPKIREIINGTYVKKEETKQKRIIIKNNNIYGIEITWF